MSGRENESNVRIEKWHRKEDAEEDWIKGKELKRREKKGKVDEM